MKKYDLILVSTFQNLDNISQLIKSIRKNKTLQICAIFVNQTDENFVVENDDFQSFIVINSPQISLSKARNIGLKYLKDNQINFNHIMFPDDDAIFSDKFFKNFKEQLCDDRNYLIDVLDLNEKPFINALILHNDKENLQKKDFSLSSSINFILTKDSIDKTGFFDENLGLGTPNFSAEDNDYFLRLIALQQRISFTKKLFIQHPSYIQTNKKMTSVGIKCRAKKYSKGLIVVLKKHRMTWQIFLAVSKAFAGIFKYFLTLKWKTALSYLYAFAYRCYYSVC